MSAQHWQTARKVVGEHIRVQLRYRFHGASHCGIFFCVSSHLEHRFVENHAHFGAHSAQFGGVGRCICSARSREHCQRGADIVHACLHGFDAYEFGVPFDRCQRGIGE